MFAAFRAPVRSRRQWYRRQWFSVLLSAAVLALAGCSDGGDDGLVTVTGKVSDKGAAPAGADQGLARIQFLRIDSGGVTDTRAADIQPDGTYEVQLPPGKYAVVVQSYKEYRGPNELESVFPGAQSPLTVDVADDQQLDVDVDKYRKG